jgi:hypothetical protein
MSKKVKFEAVDLVIENNSASGVYSANIELSRDYNVCTGICVVEKADGGESYYDIKLKNAGEDLTDFVDKSSMIVNSSNISMKPEDRFRTDLPFMIPTGNQKTEVLVETFSTTSSDLRLQVIYRLEQIQLS